MSFVTVGFLGGWWGQEVMKDDQDSVNVPMPCNTSLLPFPLRKPSAFLFFHDIEKMKVMEKFRKKLGLF